MTRALVVVVLLLAACGTKPAAKPSADCAALTGDNAVQTEMRRLECALEQTVVAIGRDDLAAIPRWIHVVHAAKQETEKALEGGAYKPSGGDLAAFVSMDQAFHGALERLVRAASDGDHGATATALGDVLGQCQGCHAVFRPGKPAPAAPPEAHSH
jgi:cytochrome c556